MKPLRNHKLATFMPRRHSECERHSATKPGVDRNDLPWVTIQLDALVPGAFYQPEVIGPDEIKLRRDEVLRALQESSLCFTKSWDDLRRQTRQ